MTTKSYKIKQDDKGESSIEIGWVLKIIVSFIILGFVSSLAVVLLGYPSLAADVKEDKAKIVIVERNQRKIDETVRGIAADTKWTGLKIDALLTELGVTKRITRPEVEDSKLEESKK